MENYYEILHIANFAEIEIVKASYKALAKLYHPDMNKDVDQSVMVKINLAYEVLGDVDKKKEYDLRLKSYLSMESDKVTEESVVNKEEGGRRSKIWQGVSNVFSAFLGAFVATAHVAQQETENAYYRASNLSDEQLIRLYIESSGYKRNGYAQVLIERSLLYKEDGRLVPSYTFKTILRRIKG